jgi:hypothetical protein
LVSGSLCLRIREISLRNELVARNQKGGFHESWPTVKKAEAHPEEVLAYLKEKTG